MTPWLLTTEGKAQDPRWRGTSAREGVKPTFSWMPSTFALFDEGLATMMKSLIELELEGVFRTAVGFL